MKKMKKILALLLAFAMVMGMLCTTSLAEEATGEDQTSAPTEVESETSTDAPVAEDPTDDATANTPAEKDPTDDSTTNTPAEKDPTDDATANTPAADNPTDDSTTNTPAAELPKDDTVADAPVAEKSADEASAGASAAEDSGDEDTGAETQPVTMLGSELLATAVDGVITLDSDVTLTKQMMIPEGSTYTLDLNGHTIISESPNGYAVQNSGTLTVGGGTINGMLKQQKIGELIITGGTYTANSYYPVYTTGGSVEIKSGTFHGDFDVLPRWGHRGILPG